jgi:hypothetical protein
MRDDVRRALAITRSSTIEDRTVDITTTGRRSGEPRRIEICFYRSGDAIYLSGIPAPRTRDWLQTWGTAVLDQWVAGSPLALVRFPEAG